uniref:Uncharacterized protein n=1 Tax=Alexandrium catenella TaxID=2925 RepID=A0A7S1Q7N0_ALECA|mmetsp:Transcript_20062/g.54690  ORF Transcript_20062/g.54690 Transcript_20062/m.54690 type:complete len:357 (+) Transcript_20062:100-1170(+)
MEAQAEPILSEDFDSEGRAPPAASEARPVAWRVSKVTAVLLLATVVVVAALTARGTPSRSVRTAAGPQLIGLDETDDDPCGKMPFLQIMSVKGNNLGRKGPETEKEEGIVYEVRPYNTGANSSHALELHLHAVTEGFFTHSEAEGAKIQSGYSPEWAKVNGITGEFGTINIKPGTNVTLQLHAYDATEKKDISLPRFALTFFDLDAGQGGTKSVEFLRINNFAKYIVTNETQLDIRPEAGATKFEATAEGTGDDNPEIPYELTPLQKNKVVSLEFKDQNEVIFELGASPGDAARVFQFVVRPIMRCAYTKLADGTLLAPDDPMSPIALVERAGGEHARASLALVLALALASAQRWL